MRFANWRAVAWSALFCLVMAAPAQDVWAQEEEDPCEKAANADQVLMTVTSDADCKLTVNGKPQATLTANQEKTVKVPGGGDGKQVLRCASTQVAGAVAEQEDLMSGGCRSYTFEVAKTWSRFTAAKKGFVTDSQTGLSWLQSDNGGDIDWNAAKKFCTDKGGRLPTQEELRELHTSSQALTPCGEYSCNLSHFFKLSGRFFWSSSMFEDQAITLGFGNPIKPSVMSAKPATAKDVRVLCVSGAK
jgi:hypothetical protein